MNRMDFLKNYWIFYLSLENRFMNSLLYVELCNDNYSTYSIEYVSQIREIGSEIDIILKEYCGYSQSGRKNISDYAKYIFENSHDIINQEVVGKGITIMPFETWDKKNASESLFWWKSYNNIKHGRVDHFKDANLKNTFFSLGALFILEKYLLKKIVSNSDEIDIVDKESSLFTMRNWKTNYLPINDVIISTDSK